MLTIPFEILSMSGSSLQAILWRGLGVEAAAVLWGVSSAWPCPADRELGMLAKPGLWELCWVPGGEQVYIPRQQRCWNCVHGPACPGSLLPLSFPTMPTPHFVKTPFSPSSLLKPEIETASDSSLPLTGLNLVIFSLQGSSVWQIRPGFAKSKPKGWEGDLKCWEQRQGRVWRPAAPSNSWLSPLRMPTQCGCCFWVFVFF